MSWAVYTYYGHVHVCPNQDDKVHYLTPSCDCEPYFDGLVYIHQSWDGREEYERGLKKVS